MSSTTRDDTTVRIVPVQVASPHNTPSTDKRQQEVRRRQVEVGSLAFGMLLAGALCTLIFIWWKSENAPKTMTMLITFMVLTSGAVVGIFVSVARSLLRSVEERHEVALARCEAALDGVRAEVASSKALAASAAASVEGNTQSALALMRSVAFAVADSRMEGDEHRARIVELWAEVVERAQGAASFDAQALRAEVTALHEEVRRLGAGEITSLAGRVDDVDRWRDQLSQDFALSQVLAIRARVGVPSRGEVIPFPTKPRDADHS